MDAIYGAGGYIKAGGRTVVSTQPSGANEHHVIVTIKPTTYVETTGGPEQSMAGGTSEYLVTLKERESGYVLTDYVKIAS
ncbi:hypothetical protein [Nocardioides daphniae]|uniref:Uncharacterized protein n=1 Tax=Nocardioides daphniae TaxID=402297 RepID=A0A4P7UG78_9ACTN|nr:hypothetical protein [Nocardioides daphniae]QCC78268.1 hypothetical protein E2C04_15680 [Nocardioides daphniae]